MKGLFVIAFIGWIIFSLWRSKTRREDVNRTWDAVRTAHGLVMTRASAFTDPTLRGEMDGYRVAVDTVRRGGSKNKQTYTRYRVHYPKLGTQLRLTREVPLASALGKMFGGQDHETGDEAFDKQVVVRAPSESRALKYLTAPRRRAIEKFLSAHKHTVITESNATFETVGLETRANAVEKSLRVLIDLARELDVSREGTERGPRPRSTAAAATGVAAALGAAVVARSLPGPDDWDDERDETAPEEDTAEPSVPLQHDEPAPAEESPQRQETVEVSDSRDDQTEPPIEIGAVPGMPEVPSIDPDATGEPDAAPANNARQQDVCATLFAEGAGLTHAREVFESDYADMFVHWTGELKSARHYYSDMVFGNEPGTRVEVSVARVASGILGEREIVAVVQLPDGADGELAPRVGETVTFEGDLASVDPFMRQVFVRNATIID